MADKKYMTDESTQALINIIKSELSNTNPMIPVYTSAEYNALSESEKPAIGKLFIISDD